MTKLGVLRCLGECGLGGGCIAGGVECAKAKSTFGTFEQENKDLKTQRDNLEAQNKELERRKDSINRTGKYYETKTEVLKDAVAYAAEQLNLIATMNWDQTRMKQQAQDAKWGLKQNKLDARGIDSTFYKWA